MALLTGAAIVGVAGSIASTTAAIVTNNRHTIIANDTVKPLTVIIDGEELGTVAPNRHTKFKVKQATPVKIKVMYKDDETIFAEVFDYDHRNFIVKVSTGILILVRAKKLRIWVQE